MEEFEKLPKVEGLPKDKKKRVVLASGAIFYNNLNSAIPLAEVLLAEVKLVNDKEELSDKVFIAEIGIPQLDSVRFGTVFIGERRTKQIWTAFNGYREHMSFSFDFREYAPSTIHYGAKKQDGKYYINPYKFSFSMIENTEVKSRFLNSKLTKLMTHNDVSVLIPALEVLTSLITPAEQSIRSKLIMLPMDDIAIKYLKKYEYDPTNEEYKIQYHEKSKKESNAAFLAYLSMNSIARGRISKIHDSVKLGKIYERKHPTILPYHPTTLNMTADGIWMDNKTFLCLRIRYMEPPRDYKITEIQEVEKKKPSDKVDLPEDEEGGKNQETKPYDIDDLAVTPGNNPSKRSPRTHISTEVTIGSIKDIMSKETIIIESEDEDTPRKKKINADNEDEESEEKESPKKLSSGDSEDTQDSKGTAKLEQKENLIENPKECIDESDVFSKVIKTLIVLKNNEKSTLENFFFIDNMGNKSSEISLCSFLYPETKYRKSKTKWAYKIHNKKEKIFIPRGALIIELVLEDGKKAYILEIEQKTKGEKFAGLLFNTTDGMLSKIEIKNLLIEIANLKGVIREKKDKSLQAVVLKNVNFSEPYTHYKDKDTGLYLGLFSKFISEKTYNVIFN
ncbi:MAG TPA: hypothetical protein EYH42_06195 [Sulfurovum sp.]|nr:hypothetical protein [Sulfurovum sp.]